MVNVLVFYLVDGLGDLVVVFIISHYFLWVGFLFVNCFPRGVSTLVTFN